MAAWVTKIATVPDRRHNNWLCRFAWVTAGAILFLIFSGGMVTSKNLGLAVPDWPTTFGYNMFLFPFSKWIGGIFFEHVHRLIASLVGFLTIILTIWLWRKEDRRWVRILGYTALGAVVLQGVLGGLRVTLLKDEIGIFHACLAQAYFGILILIALVTSRFWRRLSLGAVSSSAGKLASIAIVTSSVIYLQLALGATMRHEHRDLSILDFPTAYGKIIPDTSAGKIASINVWRESRALSEVNAFQIWLQMAHRFLGAVIGALVIAFWFSVRGRAAQIAALGRLASWWLLLIACQIALGAWTIWSNKAADIATAHVAVGATIFGIGVALSAICLQIAQAKNSLGRSIHRTFVQEASHAR